MDSAVLLSRVMLLIPLILSLTVHEFSHAWAAWRLGDDTAARMGRLTLNPIPHIDPIGTLLLPMLGIPFGWAKPVPVATHRFRRGISMATGNILTSLAGPVSNLVLGLVVAVLLGILARFAPDAIRPGQGVSELLWNLMTVNAALAVFNVIPIPPLDGSHVAEELMPYRFRDAWARFAQLSPFLLLALVWFGRGVLAGPILFLRSALVHVAGVVAG